MNVVNNILGNKFQDVKLNDIIQDIRKIIKIKSISRSSDYSGNEIVRISINKKDITQNISNKIRQLNRYEEDYSIHLSSNGKIFIIIK